VIVGFDCVENWLLKVLDQLFGSISKRNRRLDQVVPETIDVEDSSQILLANQIVQRAGNKMLEFVSRNFSRNNW
jgi:hypothetical protein